MKFLSFLAVSLFSIFSLSAAQYVGVAAGTNNATLTDQNNKGLKIGAHGMFKYGYVFSSGIRSEAEISYRTGRYKTIYNMSDKEVVSSRVFNSMHSWSYMVNALYDVVQLETYDVVPYFGIGAGFCQNTQNLKEKFDTRTEEAKIKDKRFAYQGIVGLKYAINENLSTGLEYHYFCGRSHQKDHSVGMTLVRSF